MAVACVAYVSLVFKKKKIPSSSPANKTLELTYFAREIVLFCQVAIPKVTTPLQSVQRFLGDVHSQKG